MKPHASFKRLVSRWIWLLASGTLAVLLPCGAAFAANTPPSAIPPSQAATRKITFAGMTWSVKSYPSPVGPGPNYFSDSSQNVWVDSGGALHLKIANRNGKWYSSEVIADAPLVYGDYRWTVTTPLSGLDSNAVLGLFTWDDPAPEENYREIDIEVSRWGVPGGPNAQFVVQPWDTPGHRRQFTLPLTQSSTYQFDWSPEQVQFDAWEGSLHETWTYPYPVPINTSGSGNPRINLWMYQGASPADGKDIEVVIQSFRSQPYGNYHQYLPIQIRYQTPEQQCAARASTGKVAPNPVICSIQYTVNNGALKTASYDGNIELKTGDTFKLVTYGYYSSQDGTSGHKLAIEAYLFKDGTADYNDGRFTPSGGAAPIQKGINSGGSVAGSGWVMQDGWNQIVVTLVHYYPGGNEVDDRFYVTFSY